MKKQKRSVKKRGKRIGKSKGKLFYVSIIILIVFILVVGFFALRSSMTGDAVFEKIISAITGYSLFDDIRGLFSVETQDLNGQILALNSNFSDYNYFWVKQGKVLNMNISCLSEMGLSYSWYVDDVYIFTGQFFNFTASDYSIGLHNVTGKCYTSISQINSTFKVEVLGDKDFMIIMLGDKHFNTQWNNSLNKSFEWIKFMNHYINVSFVASVGDNTYGNSMAEWFLFNDTWSILDKANIPNGVAMGNHDSDAAYGDINRYAKWFNWTRYQNKNYYGGAFLNTSGNDVYYYIDDFIPLMFIQGAWCKKGSMEWVNNTIYNNPKSNVIYFGHDLLGQNGFLSTDNKSYCYYSGMDIWNNSLQNNPNVFMALNGHYEGTKNRTYVGSNGNNVTLIMSAYHYPEGNGKIRYILFRYNQGKISSGVYDPLYNNFIFGTYDLQWDYAMNITKAITPADKKLIFIGLDGMSYSSYKELRLDNKLPNFARLLSDNGWEGNATITGHSLTYTAPGNAEIHTGLNELTTGVIDNSCGVSIPSGKTTFERLDNFSSNIYLGLNYGKGTCYIPDSILKNAKPIIDWWQNRTTYNQRTYVSSACADSTDVANKSLEFLSIHKGRPFYLTLYFGVPDCAGHAYTDISKEYNDSLINADAGLGIILDWLSVNKVNAQIIISADHGWNNGTYTHASRDVDTLTIPLLSNNISLVSGIYSNGMRKQCDVAPTILNYFGMNSTQYDEITQQGCGSLISNGMCRNNLIEIGEVCDGNSRACSIDGYLGSETCNAQCSGFDSCTTTESCGDNVKNGNEICDGNTQTCAINGYSGNRTCNSLCNGFGSCAVYGRCGDGIINGNEECDDGNLNNTDLCMNNCQINLGCLDRDRDGMPDYNITTCNFTGTDRCVETNIVNWNLYKPYNGAFAINYTSNDYRNVSNFSLAKNGMTRIIFKEKMRIVDLNSTGCFVPLNLSKLIEIYDKKVIVNSDDFREFKNKMARIVFENINFNNPKILYDGVECSVNICSNVSYNSSEKTFSVDISGFSTYEVVEGTYCGDGVCQQSVGEACGSCSADCSTCSSGGRSPGGGSNNRGKTNQDGNEGTDINNPYYSDYNYPKLIKNEDEKINLSEDEGEKEEGFESRAAIKIISIIVFLLIALFVVVLLLVVLVNKKRDREMLKRLESDNSY